MVEFIAPIITGEYWENGQRRADYFKFSVPVETEEEARKVLKASYEKSELEFGTMDEWDPNGSAFPSQDVHVLSERGQRALKAIIKRFFPKETPEPDLLGTLGEWVGGNEITGLALFYMLHNAPEGTSWEWVEFTPIFGGGGTIPVNAGYRIFGY